MYAISRSRSLHLDLLFKHTSEYTKMLASYTFSVEEIFQCKEILEDIHAAIEAKHSQETSQMKIVMPAKKEQPEP